MASARTKLRRRVVVLVLIAALVSIAAPRLVLSMTASVEYRLLLKIGGEPKLGDLAYFPWQHPYIKDGSPQLLTKRVACAAGDRLETINRAHYCNGLLIAEALTETHDGKPLEPFQWQGSVPAKAAFVLGDDQRSFDSRYFGFVPLAEMTRLKGLI